MAQKSIKDYFPSRKIQDRSKNAAIKRPLESLTVPRSKTRRVTKVLKQQEDERNQRKDNTPVCNIRMRSSSSLSSTPATNSSGVSVPSWEATGASSKPDNAKLNCLEALRSVSPLKRGAECVRLALEKKASSSVTLAKEEAPLYNQPRRKLFVSEGNDDPGAMVKDNKEKKIKSDPAVKEPESKSEASGVSLAPVKPSFTDITPLKNKAPDTTRSGKQGPKLKPFTSLEYDSPTKANKTTPEKVKSHIAEPTVIELPLPKHYGLLAEKFHCTDTIVNMFQRRGEICTFTKLKLAVQEMNGRLFDKKDLAKMKTVYPAALMLAQQKHIPGAYGREIYNSYQLTIECNVAELGDDDQAVLPGNNSVKLTTCLTSSVLLRRRQKFKRNLVAIVKQHHKEFLASLNISLSDDKIVRWHPSFVLDGIADVEEAPLPQPPTSPMCCSVAKDVLEKIQSQVIPRRMQKALKDVATSSDVVDKSLEANPANPAIDKALKGISQSLLDKIKMKEASRAKAAMTRNHEAEKKMIMLSAVPDMCRIIKNLFLADKKAAMPVEDVTNKLMDSGGTSLNVTEAHLNLILEVLPQWLKKVTVRKISYFKIDRKMSIKAILDEVEKYKNML